MTLLQTKKKCICSKKLGRIDGIIISPILGSSFCYWIYSIIMTTLRVYIDKKGVGFSSSKKVWKFFTNNTDWIFVIVQLHWPKRLSSRSFGRILILKKSRFSGIPKYVGLIYKSIWYNIAELHLTISQHVDYPIYGDTLIRDYLNFNTTKS